MLRVRVHNLLRQIVTAGVLQIVINLKPDVMLALDARSKYYTQLATMTSDEKKSISRLRCFCVDIYIYIYILRIYYLVVYLLTSLLLSSSTRRRFYHQRSSGQAVVTGPFSPYLYITYDARTRKLASVLSVLLPGRIALRRCTYVYRTLFWALLQKA